MGRAILLDTHPLSQVTHPKVNPKVQQWLKSLQKTETVIRVPEIADYELRRELLTYILHQATGSRTPVASSRHCPPNALARLHRLKPTPWVKNL
ncbi:hypothetical protein [Nostoc sp.]|uniref:hypothetical protein n=1 Tax=Nostoc sp. TaxID=1180 RepID=UPI002FFC170E